MTILFGRGRRAARVRKKIAAQHNQRLRLSVFRSRRYIYAQIIDDARSHTVAQASSLEKRVREQYAKGDAVKDTDLAQLVGKYLAERALAQDVKEVVFDRGAFMYHGRVRALAEAARAGGLVF